MKSRIVLEADKDINQTFLRQLQMWANEPLERTEAATDIYLVIYRTITELRHFYDREKRELSVATGEQTDFLATHEAWRGYPRIHVCEERFQEVPEAVVQGAIHHEIGHALLHCSPEFYTFVFSKNLRETALSFGMDLALLQQCVYLLSVAIKDREVVQWLAEMGFAYSQLSLLRYLMNDVEDEKRTWQVVREIAPLKKIVFAALLKVLLPIEALGSMGTEGIGILKDQWTDSYEWLPDNERMGLVRLAQDILKTEGKTFQEQLEKPLFLLIAEHSF